MKLGWAGLLLGVSAFAVGKLEEAPRDGMFPSRWASGIKQFVGSSFEDYDANNGYSESSPSAPISRVWFTGTQGVLSEVYWPTVDTPQTRDSQFLVSDGAGFFFEERRHSQSQVRWLKTGIPVFIVTNRDPGGRFVIERTFFTDPDRDTILQKIKITRNVKGLRFYVLHNPSGNNAPLGDTGYASLGEAPGAGLYSYQDSAAQALMLAIPGEANPFKQVSAGFEGTSDGYSDIFKNKRMTLNYKWARQGNVVLTGYVNLPESEGVSEFVMALGFGPSLQAAAATAKASLQGAADAALQKYVAQWEAYQARIRDLSAQSLDQGKLFRASVAVLKSIEDKTYEGAFVASPSVPWGEHRDDNNMNSRQNGRRNHLTGGYHLVWPRDLYQMASTFLAIDDPRSAVACFNFFKRVQYGPQSGDWNFGHRRFARDGSFAQNFWVDGESYWDMLQMDQTAMAVVLAYRLWKEGHVPLAQSWDMVRRASDFLRKNGPWTSQERWEENMGASPSTIASEISALWVAAEMADAMGDAQRARAYRSVADQWAFKPGDNVDDWTFTTSGELGAGKYYIRVEGARFPGQIWDPNDNEIFEIKNGGGYWREKNVIDSGFLELMRFGVRQAQSPSMRQTVTEYDRYVRADTPQGPGYFRYMGDMYNYDDITGQQTKGMLWPLLTGERAHYEVALARERGQSDAQMDQALLPYLGAIERFATPELMLPEQVWDKGERAGKPTGAATPLGWAHGEYIKLLRSRQERRVYDQIPAVVQRARLGNNMVRNVPLSADE